MVNEADEVEDSLRFRFPMAKFSFTACAVSLLLLAGFGCSYRAAEIRVRDVGRVSKSADPGSGWQPLIAGDGQPASVPAGSADAAPIAVREQDHVRIDWPSAGRESVSLVDSQGRLAPTSSLTGIQVTNGLLHVPYAVSPQGAFAYDERDTRRGSLPLMLETPTENLVYARYVEGRSKWREYLRWPAYVMIPTGAILTVAGVVALAAADGDYKGLQQVAGAVLLIPGAPMLGFGVYVPSLSDSHRARARRSYGGVTREARPPRRPGRPLCLSRNARASACLTPSGRHSAA
jgi:hypothetical protein